jgi:hypothetical protein
MGIGSRHVSEYGVVRRYIGRIRFCVILIFSFLCLGFSTFWGVMVAPWGSRLIVHVVMTRWISASLALWIGLFIELIVRLIRLFGGHVLVAVGCFLWWSQLGYCSLTSHHFICELCFILGFNVESASHFEWLGAFERAIYSWKEVDESFRMAVRTCL